MTREEKKKKAIIAAVACFLEREKMSMDCNKKNNAWSKAGKLMIMAKSSLVQRHGRILKS